MGITAVYEDFATIGTTPYSLCSDSTTLASITDAGVYQVFLDLSGMTVTEQYEIVIREKVRAAGSQQDIITSVVSGTTAPTWVSPSLILMHGWDVVVTKLAGTDRSIEWSIRQVA